MTRRTDRLDGWTGWLDGQTGPLDGWTCGWRITGGDLYALAGRGWDDRTDWAVVVGAE